MVKIGAVKRVLFILELHHVHKIATLVRLQICVTVFKDFQK